MKTIRGAVKTAGRLASLLLVSCTLARHSCTAFISPAAVSWPRTADSTAHAAIGASGCWTTAVAAATAGLRAGAGDVLGEEAVLAKFKRLQVWLSKVSLGLPGVALVRRAMGHTRHTRRGAATCCSV